METVVTVCRWGSSGSAVPSIAAAGKHRGSGLCPSESRTRIRNVSTPSSFVRNTPRRHVTDSHRVWVWLLFVPAPSRGQNLACAVPHPLTADVPPQWGLFPQGHWLEVGSVIL